MHSLPRSVVALMMKDGKRGSGGGFRIRIRSSRSSSELSLSELFSMINRAFDVFISVICSYCRVGFNLLTDCPRPITCGPWRDGFVALRGITSVFSFSCFLTEVPRPQTYARHNS